MSKYCKDCKHCKQSFGAPGTGDIFSMCLAPQNVAEEKVSTSQYVVGKTTDIEDSLRWKYCTTHRCDGWLAARMMNTCGKEGRWFEAKV